MFQFTTSVILIIGKIVVFRQIKFAKKRPVGYSRNGLIMIPVFTETIHKHLAAVREELKNSHIINCKLPIYKGSLNQPCEKFKN